MGQYYKVVNITKKEYLSPFTFGDGMKLMEFASAGCGTLAGLAVLLSSGNGRGGGDLRSEDRIIGSWAGDKIVIAGDYGDEKKYVTKKDCEGLKDDDGKALEHSKVNLYHIVSEKYKDVSIETIKALMDDDFIKNEIKNQVKQGYNKIGADILKVHDTKMKNYPTILEELKTEEVKEYVTDKIKHYSEDTPKESS